MSSLNLAILSVIIFIVFYDLNINVLYMKIENFDTGLKGQEDVENIIITPEENYNNKTKSKKII